MSLLELSLEITKQIATESYQKIDDNTKKNPLITLVAAVASTIFALVISPHSLFIFLSILTISSPVYISLYKNQDLVIEKIKDKVMSIFLSKKEKGVLDSVKKAEGFFVDLGRKFVEAVRPSKD
ncbi:MAG: hypothetical protein KR126chlam6_00081 [Candidatus Anoxychlamydiales bacterium]|nr:hypothetical protein [Candidatus Anoxychlamydiales bacterium]